jgi:hypothetical protein
LPEQVDGGGAEDQEASGSLAGTPTGVDDAPECLEQGRDTMDLVQDDQLVIVLTQL